MNTKQNRTNRNAYKVVGFLLCLLLCISAFCMPAFAEPAYVRVGWYEDSYHMTGENGERSGYSYEFEQSVSAYTGWKYQYVKGGWSDLFHMVAEGKLDLMAAISYTDDRAKQVLYSDLPMGTEVYYLYADLKHTDISASDLSTLNGKRVCILRGSVQDTMFRQWEEKNHIQMQVIYVDTFAEGKKLAEERAIDCVISTETPRWTDYGMSAVASTGRSDIYYIINPHRPEVKEQLDRAMRQMEYDKPFYADELYQRYLSTVTTSVLTKAEKVWLKEHGSIRMGYLENDSGFSSTDPKTGHMIGVIHNYVEFAKHSLGDDTLDFQLVPFATTEEEIQALKEGKIDVIFHFTQNPYIAEQYDFALSNTVLSMNMAAVTANTYFDEDAEIRMAVKQDDFLLKWYISYNYPKWKFVDCASRYDVENAVHTGRADCFVGEAGQMAQYTRDGKLHNVVLNRTGNTTFAVQRGNAVLVAILNKTLRTMPNSYLTGALSMYDNMLRQVTVVDFVKDNLVSVSLAAVAVFLFIVLAVVKFWRKEKAVAEHTQMLNQKLEDSHVALEKALKSAEDANSAKSTFLFNMSHDIRTPMNAILGYTRLMKQELKDPKLLDYQEKMERSGNLLLSIINNVLDMARIESGKMELDESYHVSGEMQNEVYEVFKVEAEKKHIHFTQESNISHPHILCDKTKIGEIWTNLVSNAIKYTPDGGSVTLRSSELPSDKEGWVRIKMEVIDTGIGMSEAYLPHLFESFTRERNTTMGKVGGTGLGMPIVKKLVDMMGGTIEVESKLGKGTHFTVILPHRIADEAYYKETTHQVVDKEKYKEWMKGKHILLAEDNELNAEIATVLLEEMGFHIDCVSDGIQCVHQMEIKPAGTYDLILMDIQMPNMDGYKATQAIRHFSDPAKAKIPIVAMTANAFEEDKKMAIAKGMDGHIAKPIDVEKMEETLSEVLHLGKK